MEYFILAVVGTLIVVTWLVVGGEGDE